MITVYGMPTGVACSYGAALEDGTVTLKPEDVGLKSRPADGRACRIDGTGC